MPESTPALRIRDLHFSYKRQPERRNSEPWSIAIGSLELARGEQMLLTANSGAGKSTLLHLIAGLTDPQSGSVEIAGVNIHALRGAARDAFRGRQIGMIFQTFNLLTGFSAAENVAAAMLMAGLPIYAQQSRAVDLLRDLEIATPGARVEELSVGQQQRVAVARALACEPSLVLADEPTASLDPANANACMDLIQDQCERRGAALLCVSHDPAMAVRFSRRLRLEDAKPVSPLAPAPAM
jgi:putative ABC transport system ATP-binding protein